MTDGLNLETDSATTAFTSLGATIPDMQPTAVVGADPLTLVMATKLDTAGLTYLYTVTAAVINQDTAAATGLQNVAAYVSTDDHNAANLHDTGATSTPVIEV